MSKSPSQNLNLEDYNLFFNNLKSTDFVYSKLHQIIHIHGFRADRDHRRKAVLLEALAEIDIFSPYRSTLLNEDVTPNHVPFSIDEVIDDLNVLQWRDDFIVDTLESIPFKGDEDGGGAVLETMKKKRVKKVKNRVEFNPVHLTKPRSKRKIVKMKSLSEIAVVDNLV